MRIALLLAACSLASGAGTPAASGRDAGSRHVRFDNARIAEAYRYVADRSPTFRRLVAELDASDCIVYVRAGTCAGGSRLSCLADVKTVSRSRYLSIRLAGSYGVTVVASHLAHELHHALEVARTPDVVDPESVNRLYKRIGFGNCAPGMPPCWETRGAQDIEAIVLKEMVQPQPTTSLIDAGYFGTWSLDAAGSLVEDGSIPSSGCRVNADRRFGLISSVTTTVDGSGVPYRQAFVYRLDGRDYLMSQPGERPRRTIAATPTDPFTTEFTIREEGIIVATGRWVLALTGRTLVEQTLRVDPDGHETTTVTMWLKEPSTSLLRKLVK